MQEKLITQEKIEELKKIQEFLESEPVTDDPAELIDRLTKMNAYMARSGFLMAEAQADRDAAIAGLFAEHQKAILQMPATVSQKSISAMCTDENFYATWTERINRLCVHESDNLRTQVSYAKENMALTRRGY